MSRSELHAMTQALRGNNSGSVWQEGPCALVYHPGLSCSDPETGLTVVSAGHVDNRRELERELGISSAGSAALSNNELFLRGYLRWGEACPTRIYGDWMFAAWHAREQRLFLARDHYGRTALFYSSDANRFAFASDPKTLLTLNLGPVEMDENYLAQVLIGREIRQGERTIYRSLRRLPPAHYLIAEQDRLHVRRYWRLEDTPELRLPRRQDYVEAFREVFDASVRASLTPAARYPSAEADAAAQGESGIAISLSGGLDSSAVAVTAARFLRERGERLTAFTSVPLYATRGNFPNNFGDEFSLAQATCRQAGNIDLYRIEGNLVSPIQATRSMLEILGEPGNAAANFYWGLEMQRTMQARGLQVLLTGQAGNASISWRGDPLSQSIALQLRRLGVRRWGAERLKRVIPPHWIAARRRYRIDADDWCRRSAIHPDFARRLRVFEQWLDDPDEAPIRSPRQQRLRFLEPARSTGGAKLAQMGAAHGFEFRDPTADVRVLTFTLSVPDHIFIDPETGMDRWLIRAAMEGLVPDEVRLNRRRGLQAADLVLRLRACATEVEAALDEVAAGPAARYLDIAYMRATWRLIQEQETLETLVKANTVLTRGIMAGLFVNSFNG